MNRKLIIIGCLCVFSGCSSIGSLFKDKCHEVNWGEEGQNAFNKSRNPEEFYNEKALACEGDKKDEYKKSFMHGHYNAVLSKCLSIQNASSMSLTRLGEELAKRGESRDEAKSLFEKCGVSISSKEQQSEWTQGFQSANSALCTKMGGVEFARKNFTYKNTCPKESEKDFNFGRSIGIKMKEVDDLNNEITQINKSLSAEEANLVKFNAIIAECNEKISLVKNKQSPGSSFLSECSGTTEDDFQRKINTAKKELLLTTNKINEQKRKLEQTNRNIELKYKEIDTLNNALK